MILLVSDTSLEMIIADFCGELARVFWIYCCCVGSVCRLFLHLGCLCWVCLSLGIFLLFLLVSWQSVLNVLLLAEVPFSSGLSESSSFLSFLFWTTLCQIVFRFSWAKCSSPCVQCTFACGDIIFLIIHWLGTICMALGHKTLKSYLKKWLQQFDYKIQLSTMSLIILEVSIIIPTKPCQIFFSLDLF